MLPRTLAPQTFLVLRRGPTWALAIPLLTQQLDAYGLIAETSPDLTRLRPLSLDDLSLLAVVNQVYWLQVQDPKGGLPAATVEARLKSKDLLGGRILRLGFTGEGVRGFLTPELAALAESFVGG